MSQDPIGDMLAQINNANHKFMERADMPASKLKKEVAHLLKEEGYIADYKLLQDRKQGTLRVFLKYLPNKARVIQGVRRLSRPGLRVYRGMDQLPKVRGGLGMTIVSTSKGLMTDHKARKASMGGEVIAQVW
jgi:small subunit ribosomal protein S8